MPWHSRKRPCRLQSKPLLVPLPFDVTTKAFAEEAAMTSDAVSLKMTKIPEVPRPPNDYRKYQQDISRFVGKLIST